MIDIEALRFELDCALDEYWLALDLKNSAKADYQYATGVLINNYPVPAIRIMANNCHRLILFGEISAENGFDIATIFETFVKIR